MATHSSTFALQKEPNASFPVENHGTRGLEDALLPPGSVSSVLLAVYLPSHTKAHSMKVAHSRDNTSNSGSSGRAAGLFTEKKVNGPEQRGGGGRKCTRDRAKAQHELTWDSRLHWAPTQRKEAQVGSRTATGRGSDCPITTKSPRERLGRARTPGPASQVCLLLLSTLYARTWDHE